MWMLKVHCFASALMSFKNHFTDGHLIHHNSHMDPPRLLLFIPM